MAEETKPRWRPSSRIVAAIAAVFIAGVIWSDALRIAFFLFFLAFLIAVLLDYPVRWLAKLMPRGVAAALVLLVILGGVAAGVRFAVPPLVQQGTRIAKEAPRALEKAQDKWDSMRGSADMEVPSGAELEKDIRTTIQEEGPKTLAGAVVPVASLTLSVIGTLVLLLILATFMVAGPKTYAEGIVWLFPKESESAVREFLFRVVRTMRGWLFAQLLSMTFVGIATAIGLMAIGVKGWAALAVVNFLCEFVPYVGPMVGAAPGIAVAFAESTRLGAYAALVYLGVQQLEGYLVSPLVMKHEVKLAPPVLLLWQVVMGTAFGPLGIIVATPLLALLKVSVDYFWVERTLGKKPAPAAA